MLMNRLLRGNQAETQACTYLQQQGLQLLTRNFRCPLGEIDLIMRHERDIVFIEVRYRHNQTHGSAVETVSRLKQKRLIRTAYYYLQQQQHWTRQLSYRFDIVGISATTGLQWIKNAFEVIE